jgi:rhodanese-related sulfurtransferase
MLRQIFKKEIQTVSFEDVQYAVKHNDDFLIINTLNEGDQEHLITGTMYYKNEEEKINSFVNNYDFSSKKIIIYSENANDKSAEKKYHQITSLGFQNVYIYPGGLFEWLCLQDIYGEEHFPTTKPLLDILKYKPKSCF